MGWKLLSKYYVVI